MSIYAMTLLPYLYAENNVCVYIVTTRTNSIFNSRNFCHYRRIEGFA